VLFLFTFLRCATGAACGGGGGGTGWNRTARVPPCVAASPSRALAAPLPAAATRAGTWDTRECVRPTSHQPPTSSWHAPAAAARAPRSAGTTAAAAATFRRSCPAVRVATAAACERDGSALHYQPRAASKERHAR
jgi:hypothetical protein